MDITNMYSKWVACWGNATSITDRKECTYAKNLTLRYPIRMCFGGNKLRFHFSNLTGEEDVTIAKAYVDKCPITVNSSETFIIPVGEEVVSDEVSIDITAGDTVNVSMYLEDYTQMNAGTYITGPLSLGTFAYGDYALADELPKDVSRGTNWFYFLNTVDIYTQSDNYALICYGDSITAQAWPDYLTLRAGREGYTKVSVIRRAVSGTRILREYNCITYAAYGLKGQTRFPIEMNVAGAKAVIIQHGINDIIHPVGSDVNVFRPWSDMPKLEDMLKAVKSYYVDYARELGLEVWSGTLLPIYGWRTYADFREELRESFNEWLRTSDIFDGCVDFDVAVCDKKDKRRFADGFDSGDHLHPSAKAYEAMAESVPAYLMQL